MQIVLKYFWVTDDKEIAQETMEQRPVNKLFTNYKRIVRPVSNQKVVHAFISENNNTQMSPETK